MVLEIKREAIIFPPGDLLSEEPPLETERHLKQILLLLSSLEWWWRDRPDAQEAKRYNFYAAGNLTIYYSSRQLRSEEFRGPDFFVVLDVEYKERKSWVVWEEDGKYPNLIVEIISSSTAATDKGLKKQTYQDTFRTPEYFWFDPFSLEFQGFRIANRGKYQPITPNEQGWLWSEQLELYLGIVGEKLRFFTADSELVLIPSEAALQELARAEQERIRAEQERIRADAAEAELERLRRLLRERGVEE